MTSGPWMDDSPVLCAGHQRVLVVGAINSYRRRWGRVLERDNQFVAEQGPTVWMPPLSPIKLDSCSPGAAIVEGEAAHAGLVAWVDWLGEDVKVRALRIPSLNAWRRVAPHRVAHALVTLMREVKVLARAECQERGWWTTKCPDGKFHPCASGVPTKIPDLRRWEHVWRYGKDPHIETKLVSPKDLKRIVERVTNLDTMLEEVDRLSE